MAYSLATALLLLLAPATAVSQDTVFRVKVDLVRVLATVKNTSGQLVGSLQKEDFTVLDNGVEQEVSVFERRTELPLSVSLLVDTSLSTAKDLRYEMESVQRFLKALFGNGNPQDTAALYSFAYDVTLHSSFTRRMARLESAFQLLKPSSGTSLYDALYLASQDLASRDGRHVIIVVTDGGDTTSSKGFHAALEALQRADAVMYAILVMPITSDAGRNIGGENALKTLSAGTGGRVFLPSLGPAMDAAFTEILQELRTQYLLAYYPRKIPPSKNRFHMLDVKVRQPDLRVLVRSGYYGEIDEASGPPLRTWDERPDR